MRRRYAHSIYKILRSYGQSYQCVIKYVLCTYSLRTVLCYDDYLGDAKKAEFHDFVLYFPALSCPALPCSTLPLCPTLPVLPYPALLYPALSHPVLSRLVLSCPVLFCATLYHPSLHSHLLRCDAMFYLFLYSAAWHSCNHFLFYNISHVHTQIYLATLIIRYISSYKFFLS